MKFLFSDFYHQFPFSVVGFLFSLDKIMQSKILSKIKTKRDSEKLSYEIEILLSSLYEEKGAGFDNALKTKVRAWVAEDIGQDIDKLGMDKKDYLDNLAKELKNFKTLRLDLAYEPSFESIDRIYAFVANNFGERILLDLNCVHDLVGGARVIFEGKYFDFTLKKAFEQEFSKEKDEILLMLNI